MIPLEQKSNLNHIKKVYKNEDFYNVIMFSEDTKILQFSQYQKSYKALFIIYVDLEYIIEKIDRYKNSPENSSTAKVSKHIPSGFWMSALFLFRSIENKHDVSRGKYCMKSFCEFLRECTMKTILKRKKSS